MSEEFKHPGYEYRVVNADITADPQDYTPTITATANHYATAEEGGWRTVGIIDPPAGGHGYFRHQLLLERVVRNPYVRIQSPSGWALWEAKHGPEGFWR